MLRERDESVDIPNNSRVQVAIHELVHDSSDQKAALQRFLKRADERRFSSQGERFSRDKLYDRH
jgi:predicted metallopeptidase